MRDRQDEHVGDQDERHRGVAVEEPLRDPVEPDGDATHEQAQETQGEGGDLADHRARLLTASGAGGDDAGQLLLQR